MSGPFAFQVLMVPVYLNPAGSDPTPQGITQPVLPGQGVRFALVSTSLGLLADPPTTLIFQASDPLGNLYPVTPVQDSTGNWHADLFFALAAPGGIWNAQFSCTGVAANQNAVGNLPFFVDATLAGTGAVLTPPTPALLNLVRVNANGSGGAQASPYTAVAGQTVVMDTSLGSVVVNIPVLTLAQWVEVKHDGNTVLSGGTTATINGPTGVKLEQPPPATGTFVSSVVLNAANQEGTDLRYFNGQSAGGYLLD